MTIGETHTPQAEFRDANDALYDPTTVFVRVYSPSGAVTSPAVTHPSLGTYLTTFTLSQKGVWRFNFHGEGPSGAVVIEGSAVCALEAA
jgi:hypothetical protein